MTKKPPQEKLPPENPSTMKYCDCIEQFNKKVEGSPFVEMFFILTQPHATIYAICVPKKTAKGNWSQSKQTNIIMNHCPFCGKKLPNPPDRKI